jgi:hypothetical protein
MTFRITVQAGFSTAEFVDENVLKALAVASNASIRE